MAGNTKSIDVRFYLYDDQPVAGLKVTFVDVFEFIDYVEGLADDFLLGRVYKVEATFNFDEPYKVTFFTYSGRQLMIDELWSIAEEFYPEGETDELPSAESEPEPAPVPAPDRRYQRVAQVFGEAELVLLEDVLQTAEPPLSKRVSDTLDELKTVIQQARRWRHQIGKCDHTEYII